MDKTFKRTPFFFAVLFFFVLYLLWLMAREMLGPIIFGLILAGVFFPLRVKLAKKWGSIQKATLATTIVIFLGVLLPLILIAFGVSKEALDLYNNFLAGLNQDEVNDFLFGKGFVGTSLKSLSDNFNIAIDMDSLKERFLHWSRGASGAILKGVNIVVGDFFTLVFDLFIMLLVIWVILLRGEKLKDYVFELSPLPDEQEQRLLNTFNQMNYVTLVCNGIGGVIQGLLGGVALWVTGFSSVILWTAVMVVLAFIPLVGISFVTVPAAIYLLVTGSTFKGVALFIFTAAVGLLVENWFKPKFIGDRIQIDSIFVLLTIIGGMSVFGMSGIFYGPIIGIIFLTMVEMYHDHYS